MESTKNGVPESENLVTLNINGSRFEIKPKIFKDIVASAFLELPEENKLEYYFDRHAPSFRGILDYFQRGELHLPEDFLTYMEYVAMAFFLLEFILRIATCPNKRLYFKDAVNICDIIALITMYVKLTVDHLQPSERYSISLFDFIGFLQIARVFRFFRIVKDVMGFRVLVYTIKMSTKELALLTMYLALCVALFSVVVYYCERDNMKSIPDAMWWVVITMTTVGYGDMVPITFLGKIVGSLAAISGVLLLAVTIPVFVNNFILFYTYSKSMDFNKAQKEKKGSVTTIKVSPLA
ncbi:potassium voltage-gated channel protein Shaw-like [Patella vulgata]|uniref:potassium voltage-gated channel protein Shaw-like n=1 Tax=Patella vulgata TaxID=6465 RepID=UPI0021802020|nr:potassium voltage-gated channel protein Shaw-like [Patella vulgata]